MANNLLPAATTTTILLLLLFSPPPISSTSTTTTTTTDTDSTVLDYFGNPVEAGKKYYFFFGGVGYFFGSLTTTSRPNQPKCPQYVIVSPIPSDFGPGVEFLPSDQTNKTISLSSNLNIVFSGSTPCSGKPVWRMTRNEANGGLYVTTDGVIGDETMSKSWFTIEKGVDDSLSSLVFYRVRYCPGGENDVVCGYLGLFYGDVDYNIWLTLGLEPADPFRVSFWPASVKPPASISHAHGLRARATAR